MRVLITGGAGFIGSNLTQKLLKSGNVVVAIDNFITGRPENIRKYLDNPKFTFLKHDITRPLTIDHKLLTINQIYHLACPTGVDNLGPLAQEMLLTCSTGTINILELAKKTGAKLLFTSSSEVYGDAQVFPQSESYTGNVNTTGQRSPYEEGKRFAESLIAAYVRKYNIDARIVRVFNTYGPAMSQSDTRVIPRFLKQALSGNPLTVKGRGVQKRTFCYVDDLVDGLILVMKKGKSGEVYNLGNDVETAIIDLAKLIIEKTRTKSKIKYVPRPAHDHQRRLPDLKKVKKLGWKPKTSLENGLKKTLHLLLV